MKIDENDIYSQRQIRSEYKKIDYNDYYISKLCNICNTKCITLDNTLFGTNNYYGNQCKICSRYLSRSDRSYLCSQCNTYCCINCGNVILQPIRLNDDEKKEDNTNDRSVGRILWSFGEDEFISYWIRFQWPNIIALMGIIINFLLMSSILFYVFYIESIFSSSSSSMFNDLYSNDYILREFVEIAKAILLHSDSMTKQQFRAVSIITLIIGGLWVIIVSLPLVCEQLFGWVHKTGTFTQSTMWIKTTWIYQTFFVVIIVFLVKLFQCGHIDEISNQCIILSSYSAKYSYYYSYSGMSIAAFIFVIFFWFTSSICNIYNNVQICWSSTDNLDIRYPLAFTHCLELIESVYIVSGMLLILDNPQIGLFICCLSSWIMLLWICFYPLISKCIIKHGSNSNTQNIIYNFTSISYFICFHIMIYVLLTYISTILSLYLYVLDVKNNNIPSIGHMLEYGIIIIVATGLIIMFICRYVLHKQRIQKLHKLTKLNKIIQSLTDLYEETSKHGTMDNWYDKIGKNKLNKFTNNAWSTTTDLAYLLIEFERHILYNRLNEKFLQNRKKWILSLLSCDDFEDFIPLIDTVKDSITSPPFFSLCMKALSDESYFSSAPLDICFLIMDFIVPSAQIRLIANNTLLHKNQLPQFQSRKGIIKRMISFGKDCDNKLYQFVNDIQQINDNK